MNFFKRFFKNRKKQELLVSKKEIEEQIKEEDKKLKGKKIDYDADPNWYHYVIVLGIFFLIGFSVYYGFEYFTPKEDTTKFLTSTFNYPYKVGNITYNIKFNYPHKYLKDNNFTIEPTKIDILNTINFTRVFYIYNGTDNGQVAITAIKVRNFLKYVYNINFIDKSKYFNETNCSNSNLNSKVMIFNVESNKNGVFYNKSNGCTIFETKSAKDFILLGDKFIYEMIKQ